MDDAICAANLCVSTTNLDPEVELFCQECGKDLTELDCGFDDNINPKRRMERRDRDDEEEWGRIPIPQSDDSDVEPWLDGSQSPESEQEEEDVTFETPATGKEKFSQNALMIVNNPMHVNKESTEDFAFRDGPRRDGIIRKKDGSLIIIDDPLYSMTLQTTKGRPMEVLLMECFTMVSFTMEWSVALHEFWKVTCI
jgi:hypothetical protein